MDAIEAIRKRRSVRNFTGEPIPRKDLEMIIDAGRLAASGSNQQPWDFIVITERTMITQLSKRIAKNWMTQAGAVIAVVMDSESRWWIEDGAAAIENILIASTALGYGSCWLEGNTLPWEKELKILLEVPEARKLLTLLPIGVPVEWPTKAKKPLSEVLHWEKY
jgi:nitroreductase